MGICKRRLVEQAVEHLAHPSARAVFIGDGLSDRCAVEAADWVFAKGALAMYCERQGVPYTTFETFADISLALEASLKQVPSPA